jgi:hypothetical protein
MSEELVRGRCPEDKVPEFSAVILVGRSAVELDESVIAGINSVMATLTTIGGFMCRGVVPDYVARIVLGLLHKLGPANDPHLVCPLAEVVSGVQAVTNGNAAIVHNSCDGLYRVVKLENAEQVGTEQPPDATGGGVEGERE